MKHIFLNHRSDELQWYEYIHTHGDTWGVLILPYPTLYKVNPMGDGCKRQFLYADMMSEMLYMSKLIVKIINAKTTFGPEYSYLK